MTPQGHALLECAHYHSRISCFGEIEEFGAATRPLKQTDDCWTHFQCLEKRSSAWALRTGIEESTLREFWAFWRGRYSVVFMENLIVINFNYDLRPQHSHIIQKLPQKTPEHSPPFIGASLNGMQRTSSLAEGTVENLSSFKFKIKSTILIIYALWTTFQKKADS